MIIAYGDTEFTDLEKYDYNHYKIFQTVIYKPFSDGYRYTKELDEEDIAMIKTAKPMNVTTETVPILNFLRPPNNTRATLFSMGPGNPDQRHGYFLYFAQVGFFNEDCAEQWNEDINSRSCFRMLWDAYTKGVSFF